MYFVNITDIAEEDILSTMQYIADTLKAPKAANNLLDEIENMKSFWKKIQKYILLYPMNTLQKKESGLC